jgi:hypothetical protein
LFTIFSEKSQVARIDPVDINELAAIKLANPDPHPTSSI